MHVLGKAVEDGASVSLPLDQMEFLTPYFDLTWLAPATVEVWE